MRAWARELYEAYPTLQGVHYGSSMNGHAPAVALNERAWAAMPSLPQFHRALSDDVLVDVLRGIAVRLGYGVQGGWRPQSRQLFVGAAVRRCVLGRRGVGAQGAGALGCRAQGRWGAGRRGVGVQGAGGALEGSAPKVREVGGQIRVEPLGAFPEGGMAHSVVNQGAGGRACPDGVFGHGR